MIVDFVLQFAKIVARRHGRRVSPSSTKHAAGKATVVAHPHGMALLLTGYLAVFPPGNGIQVIVLDVYAGDMIRRVALRSYVRTTGPLGCRAAWLGIFPFISFHAVE